MRAVLRFLVASFGLTFSTGAFARSPPALVERQQSAAHATCSGGGYRDMNRRLTPGSALSPEAFESRGYRDMNWRLRRPQARADGSVGHLSR
jgi:hypothetical protein